jgi:hypothetical protein
MNLFTMCWINQESEGKSYSRAYQFLIIKFTCASICSVPMPMHSAVFSRIPSVGSPFLSVVSALFLYLECAGSFLVSCFCININPSTDGGCQLNRKVNKLKGGCSSYSLEREGGQPLSHPRERKLQSMSKVLFILLCIIKTPCSRTISKMQVTSSCAIFYYSLLSFSSILYNA